MRAVLTIIAVALVALLTTALIAPLFVDWSAHRAEIEARLGAMAGGRVVLTGPITLRLLPIPYLDVGAGSAAGAGPGAPRLAFEKARLELALVKLASGKIRFTEIRLEKPVLTLTRGADGSLNLPLAPSKEADAVGFDRLVARDGTIRIAAGAGAPARTIAGVGLDADAPSLAGPYHATGQFSGPSGAPLSFRVATETAGPAGTPIRVSVAAGPNWPALEFDGMIALAGAQAKGQNLAGAATLTGTAAGPDGPLPWRVSGRMTADLDEARLINAEFRFGPEERAVRAEGSATLVAGSPARLTVVAKAKQANVDALLRRKGEDGVPPARALALLAGAIGPALAGSGAMTIVADVGAGDVILGSETLSDLSAGVRSQPDAPLKTRFSIGLPGQSRLSGDGAIETGAAAKFNGAIDFMSADLERLRDWASQGAPDFSAGAQKFGAALSDALGDRSLSVAGDVEASAVGFSGKGLKITLDRSTLTGALAFTAPVGADPGRLYMDLSSDSLDVEALPSVSAGAALVDGLDLSLSLRAKALHVAHVGETAIDSGSLLLKLEKSGPKATLDRLSVDNLGGASVEAEGAYGPDGATATGHLSADRLGDFALLVSRLAPGDWSKALAGRAPLLSPASLSFEARGAGASGAPALASLSANGAVGKTQARLTLEPGPKGEGQIATLDLVSPDAGALLRQLGLGATAAQGGRGHIALSAAGAWAAGYDVEASGALAGADISARGHYVPTADGDEARLFGSVKLKGGNVVPLASALGLAPPGGTIGPVEASADLTLRGERWTATRLAATIAGVRTNGDLAYEPPAKPEAAPVASPDLSLAEEAVSGPAGATEPQPAAVTGELSFDRLPLADLLALALGPPQPAKAGALWSEAKFAPAPLSLPPLAVRVKVGTLDLADGLAARDFSTELRLDKGRLDFDDMATTIMGGAASGRATLRRDRDAATLTGALNAERLSILRPGFSGRVGGRLEFASTGKSPAALIAGLAGDGAAEFSGAELKRSDPAALDHVVARVQAPEAQIDETNIAYALGNELDRAALPIPDGPAPVTLSAGTVNLGPLPIARPRGEASLGMSLDLMRLSAEAKLTLSAPSAGLKFWSGPPPTATVTVRDALEAPKRQVDAAALSAGLATQAIARESDRIAALEADIRERAFFNRRLKGERFMDKRAAEIEDWRAEQERLKALAERLAAEKAAEQKAADEKAAAEKAAAEKAAREKAAAEKSEVEKVAAERAAVEKAALEKAAAEKAAADKAQAAKVFPQPELPPDLPVETAPIAKPTGPAASAKSGDEVGANGPPAPVPLPPAKPKPRPAPEHAAPTVADPTAGGLY